VKLALNYNNNQSESCITSGVIDPDDEVFDKTPSTTLNQAAATGCALQCAMLLPTFKVREFSIQDVQPYGIRLHWQDESSNNGDMEVFPKNHQQQCGLPGCRSPSCCRLPASTRSPSLRSTVAGKEDLRASGNTM